MGGSDAVSILRLSECQTPVAEQSRYQITLSGKAFPIGGIM